MMPHADFVHLRVHSAYSLLEGAIRIGDLVAKCGAESMPAVAITDTDNLFGALEFSSASAAGGIQPIIGCQLSLAPDGAEELRPGARNGGHKAPAVLIVVVQNETGYANLLKLVSSAYLDVDDASRPQVPLSVVEAHAEGLIALTGGAAGPVGRHLTDGQGEKAEAALLRLAAAFPGRLYVEVSRHGLDGEAAIEPALIDLAYRHDLPLVATNEAFFIDAEMFEAHDALLCVAENRYVSQNDRRRLNAEFRFKSAAEMRQLFADLPEALDNTVVIARRCAFMAETREPILPPYATVEGLSEAEELRRQAQDGLERRLTAQALGPDTSAEEREKRARPYRERLDYELGVIVEMGFAGYFLIVSEFIRWAKEHGIPVGPGRGSGAGSVVAWSLTITDLDPLRFGLLFERFLNPERVSMPDFDIDFCQDRRDEVIRHVQDKYGADRVAQIITFGKLQARAVLRDVGRVLEMPYPQVDRICKLVPNNPANPVTLDQAIAGEPQLQQMVADEPAVERLIGFARQLEGLYRHASTHAAGVVIGDRRLDELVPLYRDPRSTTPVTGFNMKYVEQAGLVKFDFLGLKTLTVLSTAVGLLGARGVELDLAELPLDDVATFKMIESGDTTGIFQLESSGMRDVLRKLRPDTFEDIIAVVALYRPGPMDNIPSYIRRKHGEETPDYLYPNLKGILEETFGIMIYQEQVMQIAQELAGFSLGKADLLRRAMGKKIKAEMDEQRQAFVDGATARGVPEGKAANIFELVAKFAGYGFNKSHAAAYALVAYQTAYLKANYPVEFLAASMTLDINNTDKLNVFNQELSHLGIALLPPDINASAATFTVGIDSAGAPGIRYALGALKNVGAGAMEALVGERQATGPFKDMDDFARRLDARAVNKRQLENLVRAGVFDNLNPNRKQLFEAVETLLRQASAAADDRDSGQIGLFGETSLPADTLRLCETADWPRLERLREELDAVGFYLSGHPLDAYAKSLKRAKARSYAEVVGDGHSGPVTLAGTVNAKRLRTSKTGSRFAFVQLSDTSGMFELTVFSEVLGSCAEALEVGSSILVKATAQFEGEAVRLTALAVESLDNYTAR
ncbi:MAG: DNA polymerase III subunit alpha, partial [Rhodospirillales bacterium]|nr:DNA polymerase III subunit alpha [Rhodospirillales bacterium]